MQAKDLQVTTRPARTPTAVVTGANYAVTPRAKNWTDRLAELRADTRGALMVEYSVLIGAVAIAGSLGLVVVGLALVHSFDFVRGLLLCPIP